MQRHLRVVLLVVLLSVFASARADEGARFNAWLEQEWETTLKRSPLLATMIGDARYNDRMVDFTTEAWRIENRREQERRLRELKAFDRALLHGQDRLSYDVLKRDLEEELASERFPDWMQPLDQFGGFPGFLGQMGGGSSIQPFATVKDYDDWYARLSASVPVLDGVIANMRLGMAKGVTRPRLLMEKTLPQVAALAVDDPEQSVFWGPLKDFPAAVPPAERARLTAQFRSLIKERVAPAYRRLHDFVRDEYMPAARTTTAWSALPDGAAWYAFLVKQNTTTELTPDVIHAVGQREVARILAEMDGVRRQVRFEGDLPTFLVHMRDDPRYYYTRPEEALAGFKALQARINPRLPALFDLAPKADYEVVEVEAFRAKSAAAASYMQPSADGSRPGKFYINTADLRALPKYGMETLSLHEASPGHHFQLSIAQETTTLPKFRRFGTFYTAYVEGWAVYAETLGRELGLFTDPYDWYGHLSDQQLRAMRLVVDTGLHHKGWTRQQAIDYMLANSSMPESDVVVEVDRYLAYPGQALGYKIGQLEIARLRREAEQALGSRFDIKKFHRLVLTDGALPMSVLATKVEEWVAAQKAPH